MKALLANAYAPLTFNFGFIEQPFSACSEASSKWQEGIDLKFGTNTEHYMFDASLDDALPRLEPLTSPLDRYLLVETRSAWTAVFSNGLRVSDVYSVVSYLPILLGCRGLEVTHIPDRSDKNFKDALRIYGAVAFSFYGAEKTDSLNTIRHIAVTNDVDGWQFVAQGEVQPFEKPENYRKRSLVDRFTVEMLESYCAAVGIQLFDASFYGRQCLVSHIVRTGTLGPTMSISEARSHLYL